MVHDQRRKLLHQKLQLHYGYTAFRSLQLNACEAVLDGHDTLLILPTGGPQKQSAAMRHSCIRFSASSTRGILPMRRRQVSYIPAARAAQRSWRHGRHLPGERA